VTATGCKARARTRRETGAEGYHAPNGAQQSQAIHHGTLNKDERVDVLYGSTHERTRSRGARRGSRRDPEKGRGRLLLPPKRDGRAGARALPLYSLIDSPVRNIQTSRM